jgi:hypothetical protein
MTTHIRACLILALVVLVPAVSAPSALADKKGGSNSNSNSDNKKKDKDDEQTNQRDNRDRGRHDNQKSAAPQVPNFFQGGSNKQRDAKGKQPAIIGNNPQNSRFQKLPQFQNNPKPDNQQQDNKNKWQMQSHRDHKELHNWVVQFGGDKPFSAKWYKDHPKAWHHHHHDHDDRTTRCSCRGRAW